MTQSATPKPKQSLKDIARRVSSVPPGPNAKPLSRPRAALDSMRPVTVSAPPPPPAHQMTELAKLCESTANPIPQPVAVPTAKPRRSRANALPILVGVAVGLGAIALSITVVTKSTEPPTASLNTPTTQPAPVATEERPEGQPLPGTEAVPQPTTVEGHEGNEGREAPATPSTAEPKPTQNDRGAAAEKPVTTTTGSANADEAAAPPDPKPTPPQDTPTLSGAMAEAVGGSADQPSPKEAAGAAAPGSVPMTPSQGQVQSALASVRGAARGCVAEMDGPSRVTLTFGSDGRVSNVSVSGAAGGKPAASCIRSALSSARVHAFQSPSFTVGISLRPE